MTRPKLLWGAALIALSLCVIFARADDTSGDCAPGRTWNTLHNMCFEPCPPGTYCQNGEVKPCEPGTYNADEGAGACEGECPEHTTSNEGATSADECFCVGGFFRENGACVPEEVPAGGFSLQWGNVTCCAASLRWVLRAPPASPSEDSQRYDADRFKIDASLYVGDIPSEDIYKAQPLLKVSGILNETAAFAALRPSTVYTLRYVVSATGKTWTLNPVDLRFRTLHDSCESLHVDVAGLHAAASLCPPGQYLSGCTNGTEPVCASCPPGTHSASSHATYASKCLLCPSGTYSRAGSPDCLPLPPSVLGGPSSGGISSGTANPDCRPLPGTVSPSRVCWDGSSSSSSVRHIPGIRLIDNDDESRTLDVSSTTVDEIGGTSAKIALPVIYLGVILGVAGIIVLLIYNLPPLQRVAALLDILYCVPDRDIRVTEALGVPVKVPSLLRGTLSVVAIFTVQIVWAYAINDFVRYRYAEERTIVTLTSLGTHSYDPVEMPRLSIALLGTSLTCSGLTASVNWISNGAITLIGSTGSSTSLYRIAGCAPIVDMAASGSDDGGRLYSLNDARMCASLSAETQTSQCIAVELVPNDGFFLSANTWLQVLLGQKDAQHAPWLWAQAARIRLQAPSWWMGATSWASTSVSLSPPQNASASPFPPGFGSSFYGAFGMSRALLIRPGLRSRGYELTVDGPGVTLPDDAAQDLYNRTAADSNAAPTPAPLGIVFAMNMSPTVIRIRQVEMISLADLATRLVSYTTAVLTIIGICVTLGMKANAWYRKRHARTNTLGAGESMSSIPLTAKGGGSHVDVAYVPPSGRLSLSADQKQEPLLGAGVSES